MRLMKSLLKVPSTYTTKSIVSPSVSHISQPLGFIAQSIPYSWAVSDMGKGNRAIQKEWGLCPFTSGRFLNAFLPLQLLICDNTLPVNGIHKQCHLAAAAEGNVISTTVLQAKFSAQCKRRSLYFHFTRLWHCWRKMSRQHAEAYTDFTIQGWQCRGSLHTEA